MNKAEYQKKQDDAERKRHEAEERAERNEIVIALKTIAEQDKAAEQQEERANRFHRLIERRTFRLERKRYWLEFAGTVGLWLAAFVGVIAIIVSSIDSHNQLVALNGQAQELKNQRLLLVQQTRANLRREAPSLDQVTQKQPDGTQKLIGWTVTPRWTNAGSTSAKEVRGWFNLKMFDATFDAELIKTGKCPALSAPNPSPPPSVVAQGSGLAQAAVFLPLQDVVIAQTNPTIKFIILWGHMEYIDVYPETPHHHDDWCIRLFPNDWEHSVFSPFNMQEDAE